MLTSKMVLARSIFHAGKMLLKAGSNNIDKYKSILQQTGITFVYIEDDNSEGIEIPDVISEEVRAEAKEKLRDVFLTYQKRNILNILPLNRVVNAMVDELFYAPDIALSLSDTSSKEDELVRHSVNTAVYAGLIGKSMNYNKPMLQKLIYGALLHDLGVVKLNPRLFMKREAWSPAELEEYRTHTQLGYDALKTVNELTELSKIVALSHHERLDGTGYPQRIRQDNIHEMVRIVSIADDFDEMVSSSGEYHSHKYTVNQAMEKLMQDSVSKLDAALNGHFMQRIAVYPNGCIIKLSDNSYGLVKEQNKGMPYRPLIRIITDQSGNPIAYREVNLVKELSLTIVESEMESNEKAAACF